jgi:hypothetical protein
MRPGTGRCTRSFSIAAAWSLPQVSRLLLMRVVVPLIDRRTINAEGQAIPVDLNIDDTTCGRCGKHVAWAGYFKDASISNTLKTVVHWAHNWVKRRQSLRIGCVTIRETSPTVNNANAIIESSGTAIITQASHNLFRICNLKA